MNEAKAPTFAVIIGSAKTDGNKYASIAVGFSRLIREEYRERALAQDRYRVSPFH